MRGLLLCLVAWGGIALGGWQRSVASDNTGINDSPPPHPLAYFKMDPCLRPASDSFVGAIDCPGHPSPIEPGELEHLGKTKADLIELGTIGGFTIYDLWYSRAEAEFYQAKVHRKLRSTLVKVGEDEYREVDTNICLGGETPDEVISLDGEPVLVIKYHDGGQHLWTDDTLFTLSAAGLDKIDFTAVGKATAPLTPPHMRIRTFTDDHRSLTYTEILIRDDLSVPDIDAPDHLEITVIYRFINKRIVVTSAQAKWI